MWFFLRPWFNAFWAINVYLRPRFNAFGASNVYLRPRFNAFGASKFYLRPRFNVFGASNIYLRPRFNILNGILVIRSKKIYFFPKMALFSITCFLPRARLELTPIISWYSHFFQYNVFCPGRGSNPRPLEMSKKIYRFLHLTPPGRQKSDFRPRWQNRFFDRHLRLTYKKKNLL